MDVKIKGDGPIIVIDDSVEDLEIVKIVFSQSQVKNPLVLINHGKQALEYMDAVVAEKAIMPALIFVDINMPDINGHEVVRSIRTKPQFHDLPIVVMLTSSNDVEDMKKAVKAGANGYQVKPFGIDEYIKFANSLIAA